MRRQQAGRDVHRRADDHPAPAPQAQIVDRALQDEQGQFGDPVAFLGQRDERVGPQETPRRMFPADQRLDARDLVGREVQLRLVEDLQFPVLDPLVQLAHQGNLLRQRRTVSILVIAPGFPVLEREAGGLGGAGNRIGPSDAKTQRHVDPLARHFERAAHRRAQSREVIFQLVGLHVGRPGEDPVVDAVNRPRGPGDRQTVDEAGEQRRECVLPDDGAQRVEIGEHRGDDELPVLIADGRFVAAPVRQARFRVGAARLEAHPPAPV